MLKSSYKEIISVVNDFLTNGIQILQHHLKKCVDGYWVAWRLNRYLEYFDDVKKCIFLHSILLFVKLV